MEQHITIDNTYMNVIRFGNGPRNLAIIAGVSLTGLEGMGDALADAFSILTDDFTVYVFDRVKDLKDDYSIEDMANDIYVCLNKLGVEKISIYGASQGGMIGQVLSIEHPNMVEKLVVCSTISRLKSGDDKVIKLWIEAAKERDVEKINTLFLEYVYSEKYVDSIKDMIPALIKNGTAADCDRFAAMVEAIYSFDVYDQLDKIQCPTLVIADKKDKVFGHEPSMEIVNKLNCEYYIYNQYSHAVYDEAPDIKERIFKFLMA